MDGDPVSITGALEDVEFNILVDELLAPFSDLDDNDELRVEKGQS